ANPRAKSIASIRPSALGSWGLSVHLKGIHLKGIHFSGIETSLYGSNEPIVMQMDALINNKYPRAKNAPQ
ncbi:MAG: hypothetical protein ACTHVF_03380, partial [Halomonas sp.]